MAENSDIPADCICPQCGNRIDSAGFAHDASVECPLCGTTFPVKPLLAASNENAGTTLSDERLSNENEEYGLRTEPTPKVSATIPAYLLTGGDADQKAANESDRGTKSDPIGRQEPKQKKRGLGEEQDEEASEEEPSEWPSAQEPSLSQLFCHETFSFPFSLQSQAHAFLLAIGAAPMLLTISMIAADAEAESTPLVQFSGGYFTGIAMVVGCLWGMAASGCGIAILRDTAYGARRIEWPNLLMGNFGDLLSVAGGMFYGALPGVAIALLTQASGSAKVALMTASILLSFPPCLLSMLETNSAMQPISRPIWRSVFQEKSAWGYFYLTSISLAVVASLLLIVTIHYGGSLAGVLSGSLVLSAAWMIYFRLLGRLAWYCSQSRETEYSELEEEE